MADLQQQVERHVLGAYPDKFLGNLGGNAFPGTIITAIIVALLFAVDSANTEIESCATARACDEALAMCSQVASAFEGGRPSGA